jgi:hypothetical protein
MNAFLSFVNSSKFSTVIRTASTTCSDIGDGRTVPSNVTTMAVTANVDKFTLVMIIIIVVVVVSLILLLFLLIVLTIAVVVVIVVNVVTVDVALSSLDRLV